MATKSRTTVETHPLTPARWRDLTDLFSTSAVTRHCWCMWPRLATDYRKNSDATNRRALKRVVDTAPAPPGVLAYVDGVPAGWCAIAPREDYPKLERSRVTKPLDDKPVWSVVCFFVRTNARGKGVMKALLTAAVDLARQHGARIVEGYPVEDRGDPFHGVASVFRAVGFSEVTRPVPQRPIMRLTVRRRR
jgi:GNAT superfamily N-acetyltransferase